MDEVIKNPFEKVKEQVKNGSVTPQKSGLSALDQLRNADVNQEIDATGLISGTFIVLKNSQNNQDGAETFPVGSMYRNDTVELLSQPVEVVFLRQVQVISVHNGPDTNTTPLAYCFQSHIQSKIEWKKSPETGRNKPYIQGTKNGVEYLSKFFVYCPQIKNEAGEPIVAQISLKKGSRDVAKNWITELAQQRKENGTYMGDVYKISVNQTPVKKGNFKWFVYNDLEKVRDVTEDEVNIILTLAEESENMIKESVTDIEEALKVCGPVVKQISDHNQPDLPRKFEENSF